MHPETIPETTKMICKNRKKHCLGMQHSLGKIEGCPHAVPHLCCSECVKIVVHLNNHGRYLCNARTKPENMTEFRNEVTCKNCIAKMNGEVMRGVRDWNRGIKDWNKRIKDSPGWDSAEKDDRKRQEGWK